MLNGEDPPVADTENTAQFVIGGPSAANVIPAERSRDDVVTPRGETDTTADTADTAAAAATVAPIGGADQEEHCSAADVGGSGSGGSTQAQGRSKLSMWCISGIVLIVLIVAAAVVLLVVLRGHRHGSTPIVPVPEWDCRSDLQDLPSVALSRKGLTLDVNTLDTCSDRIPRHWPHATASASDNGAFDSAGPSATSVQVVRLSASAIGNSQKSLDRVVAWVHTAKARVLLNTQLSCNETADDQDWAVARKLLRALGSDHVLGVSFGNELELLFTQPGVDKECAERLWHGGYITRKLADRVSELDEMAGFSSTPVTSSIGWLALADDPFYDKPDARVNSMLKFALERFGKRWAFAVNIYPYFNEDYELDANTTSKCTQALAKAECFDGAGCGTIAAVADVRRKMALLNVSADHPLWVTELGWSWPKSPTLSSDMILCPAFSAERAFRDYYAGFLAWDLSLPAGPAAEASAAAESPSSVSAPDYVFWATLRDAGAGGGYRAHLGLVATCETEQCKLQKNLEPDPEPPSPACNSTGWPACSQLEGLCCPAEDGRYLECCNRPAPVDRSSCSSPLWPGCAGLAGDCCPTQEGTYLACCGGSAAPGNESEIQGNKSGTSRVVSDEVGQVSLTLVV